MTTPTHRAAPSDERSEPTADVLDAAVRLARIRQRMFARLEPATIAQYHVVRRIGGGAMGLVFAAWDPSLDRPVAIKVLRDPVEGGGEELRTEAQALARLGHPNVVAVFEVGDHDGQLYLAMEYIDGQTLREWASQWRETKRRDWAALRDIFAQVAHGLGAAHAAGVVHRDVKPDNIMIDADGRVRIMDFGLARNRHAPRNEGSGPHDTATLREANAQSEGSSTVTGICGTPAYMAPEQFEGQRAAAPADQFSLGASLYEVVYGKRVRPASLAAAAATADEPIELGDGEVPRALRRTLQRMLAIDPAARFDSMGRVAAELTRQNHRSATRWAAVAIGTVIAATGIAAGLALNAPEDHRCTGAATQLAGVWDADTSAALEQTLTAETSGLGQSTWAWASPVLDDFRDRWVAEYRDTCEATHVRRELPAAEMDRRVACMYDRRRHLAAAVDLLREARHKNLLGADRVIGALPSVEACSDPDYVAAEHFPVATDDAAQSRAEAIAHARARFINGETTRAHDQVQAAGEDARAAGDVVALARAQLLRGRILGNLLRYKEARTELVDSYDAARRNNLPIVASDAALTLSKLTTINLGHFDEGMLWLKLVEIEWPAVGDPRRTMLRALARAKIMRVSGNQPAAFAAAEEVLALLPRIEERPLLVARVKRNLASMYLSMGTLDPGVPLAERALVEYQAVLGVGHPATEPPLATLALARRHMGDMDGALEVARERLEATERGLGPNRLPLVPGLESLASAQRQTGALSDALSTLNRAQDLLGETGASPLTRARISWQQGQLLTEQADPNAAAATQRKTYDWAREALGEENPETVRYRVSLAIALRRAGNDDEAARLLHGVPGLGATNLETADEHVAMMHEELAEEAMERAAYDDATLYFTHALDFWGAEAEDSYAVVPLHLGLCEAKTAAGTPKAALPHCEAAQTSLSRSKGVGDGTTARLHTAFADTLDALGRADDASTHRKQAPSK